MLSFSACGWRRLPVRARGVALINALRRYLICIGARVLRDMETRAIVGPVDQAVPEYRIRARDSLGRRYCMPDFPRRHRIGDVDDPQAVAIPCVEDEVLEHRGVVILLRHRPTARSPVGLRDRL